MCALQAPEEWRKVWEGPDDPVGYIQGVVEKNIKITKWVSLVEKESLLKSSLNLSDLLNPGSFLSAFKQYCARYCARNKNSSSRSFRSQI